MSPENSTDKKSKRPLWLRITLWTAAAFTCLMAVTAALLCLVVWILTPEKLTPLVEKYANEYLNAEVSVQRVELNLRKSFPKLELSVDTLTIVSKSLQHIDAETRAALPAYADTLLRIPHLSGSINLANLLTGCVDLHDVRLNRPAINVVYADSLSSNLDIVPPDTTATESTTVLPRICIDHFVIDGEAPICYFSLPDSIDMRLTIMSTRLSSDSMPVYRVKALTRASASMGSVLPHMDIDLGIDGTVQWDLMQPQHIVLTNFSLKAGPLDSNFDLAADLTDTGATIQEFSLQLRPALISDIINILPDEWAGEFKTLKSDMNVSGSMMLRKPYQIASDSLPCMSASLDINDGSLDFGQIHILRGGIGMDLELNGDSLKASTVNLRHLRVKGKAMDWAIDAKVNEPFHDPLITGNFSGRIDLSRLPSSLTQLIPAKVSGILSGTTGFRFRVSHLTPHNIHRIKMDGDVRLDMFHLTDSDSISAYVHKAEVKFGTNSKIVNDSIHTDSLLTMSATIDSARIVSPDMTALLKDFKMGMGCKNTASMLDTTSITPIGASIHAGSVFFKSDADSTRIFMRDMDCGALLTRFNGEEKVPVLGMQASLRRAFFSDRHARMMLENGHFDITAHLNKRRPLSARMQARYDSIAAAHPGISADSIRAIMLSGMRRRAATNDDVERMSFSLDKGTAALLRRLDVKGSLSASSGRLLTPMFPLRNSFTNLDCQFTTDSVILHNVEFAAGESDLRMKGSISNLRNSLTSSRSRNPLRLDLSLESDTFNINQLTQAMFKGMLAAQNHETLALTDVDTGQNYMAMQDSINASSEDTQGAVLIPVNVAAEINVDAKNVIYADVPLDNFHGTLLVENGALNLRDLSAHTDIGSASMNALYYAPRKSDIMFGMGLKLNDFHIGKVVQLMPQIDSIMPILKGISGIIDVNLATTTRIDSLMNFELPSLKAALQMQGDSLVVLDPDTYRTMAKWLMFKNKQNNMINHMEVEMVVENSMLELYPFMFDFDRYRLGVMGSNDLAMNLNYHVAVLKSPLPFKFGINITGTADDMKIRVGKARFKENMVGERLAIADTTRINLIAEIDRVFKRGVNAAKLAPLKLKRPDTNIESQGPDTIAQSDSIVLINAGLIEGPMPQPTEPDQTDTGKKKNKKKKR